MAGSRSLELLIGTGNRAKAREIKLALENLPWRLHFIERFPDILIPEESGNSYRENAIIKAQAYARQTGFHALADDSGLEVAAMGGAPGLMSARFGGNGIADAERTELLLSRLSSVEPEKRQARFICVVAVAEPTAGILAVAEGACSGRIARVPAGYAGFGFDPIFIPDGYEMTFAQMPFPLKSRISHRARALAATREFLARFSDRSLTPGLAGS